jgi:heme exporter protein A
VTVRENLAQWGGGDSGIDGAIARFGLNPSVSARLLSAGQKRRLALARLLARPASLWLLDEPTVALDRDSVSNLMTLIADHRAAGGMCAVSTNVALALAGSTTLELPRFAPS